MPSAEWHNRRNDRWLKRAKAGFLLTAGMAWFPLAPVEQGLRVAREAERAFIRRYCEIRELPDVTFKDRHLKRSHPCPHCGRRRNYPEGHFWAVVDVRHVICPWCLVRG